MNGSWKISFSSFEFLNFSFLEKVMISIFAHWVQVFILIKQSLLLLHRLSICVRHFVAKFEGPSSLGTDAAHLFIVAHFT